MTTHAKENYRENVVEFLRQETEGPRSEYEELSSSPKDSYITGILFPRESEYSSIDTDDNLSSQDDDLLLSDTLSQTPEEKKIPLEVDNESFSSKLTSEYEESIRLANTYRQSALGLSFICVPIDAIIVDVKAAVYSKVEKKKSEKGKPITVWKREPAGKEIILSSSRPRIGKSPLIKKIELN